MAGKLVLSTLNDSSGVLGTQNGMKGIAKAWANWNGTSGASPVIRDSFNVSSITRNSTGNYTVSFTTAMPNTNYSVVGQNETNTATGPKATTYNTGSVTIDTTLYQSSVYDSTYNNIAIFSS